MTVMFPLNLWPCTAMNIDSISKFCYFLDQITIVGTIIDSNHCDYNDFNPCLILIIQQTFTLTRDIYCCIKMYAEISYDMR